MMVDILNSSYKAVFVFIQPFKTSNCHLCFKPKYIILHLWNQFIRMICIWVKMQFSYSVLHLLCLPKQQLNKSSEVRPSIVLIRLCYIVMLL